MVGPTSDVRRPAPKPPIDLFDACGLLQSLHPLAWASQLDRMSEFGFTLKYIVMPVLYSGYSGLKHVMEAP
eukprot:scaffold309549_cov33-Prasinocladus_malaysianus.AAC.1